MADSIPTAPCDSARRGDCRASKASRHIGALAIALIAASALSTAQAPTPPPAFIAFRLDKDRVVATIRIVEVASPPEGSSASPPPLARYGYSYTDPTPSWVDDGTATMHPGDRWVIHAGPRQLFHAEAERVVGGSTGCQGAIGVLLKVAPAESAAFATGRANYFVAERSERQAAATRRAGTSVGVVTTPATAEFKRSLESTLAGVLERELPRVRSDAAEEISRMASSPVDYHRSWARKRQAIENDMRAGRSRVVYDVQSFHLAPDGGPLHFVRAYWMVGQEQGFAAALWLRGESDLQTIDVNVRPASWLRMFEFQGSVSREHLGQILNVLDLNGDGWGEVILASGGYESMELSLLTYSPAGFQPAGVGYSYGC